jgi:hypothetical protein
MSPQKNSVNFCKIRPLPDICQKILLYPIGARTDLEIRDGVHIF